MSATKPSPTSQTIFQVVGYKNTGKTTMVCRLTELYKNAGCTVGTIKRDAHNFQLDTPGTDTWKHQAAGADFTAITSSQRTAIFKQQPEPLHQLISHMQQADVLIIEGFKTADYPKLVLIKTESDLELLAQCTNVMAIAAWPDMLAAASSVQTDIPVFNVNHHAELYERTKQASKQP
jgi:molybdopterin-guanine dinucleotide biosynthesis protein B